jgi:hypothetical protein
MNNGIFMMDIYCGLVKIQFCYFVATIFIRIFATLIHGFYAYDPLNIINYVYRLLSNYVTVMLLGRPNKAF